MGFAGNEWADMFARRAAAINPPPPPPIPLFHLHQGNILISGKPNYHLFRHLIPKHAHPDLHTRSFDIWRYSSFFSRLNFSWPNGLINLPDYEYFTQIDDRHCSLCNQPRGLAGPCKHSTQTGHSVIKLVANSAA